MLVRMVLAGSWGLETRQRKGGMCKTVESGERFSLDSVFEPSEGEFEGTT